MSLIQEALKRKLEEQNNAAPVVVPLAPAAAAVGPSRGGAFGRILGFLVLIVLLLCVAVSLFYLAARKWNWQDALAEARSDASEARVKWEQRIEQAPEVAPSPAAVPEETRMAAAVPSSLAPTPALAVRERVGDMKAKVTTLHRDNAEMVSGEPAPAPVPAAVPSPDAVAAVPDSPASPSTPAPTAGAVPEEPKRKGVAWPRIAVNGILARGKQGGGAAIINNRMVSANESIEGALVVEVQARGVLMEYKGESRLLMIGQTSD